MRAAPAKILASLLENGDEKGHLEEISRPLARATDAIFIVAFARYTGWTLIRKALRDRAAKGLKATFVIGLNFYQSEPTVLREIQGLRSRAKTNGGEIRLYIGQQSGATLHPKVYWVKGPSGQTLIVGSANMTSGGLSGNHELSVLLTGSAAKHQAWLERWINARIEAEDIVEATEELIGAYEKRRDVHEAAMRIAERKASRAMQANPGDPVTLADLLVEMRADTGSEGFDASTKQRRGNLPRTRDQLEVLARKPDLKRRAFLTAYEELIGYWHSSGMTRGKTTVAREPGRFQAALRALAAERSDDPAVLFDLLKGHFNMIPRAGTNVLTEILHARDPSRLPVMNQNSVNGMRLANITDYPRVPTKATVDGACYARFAAHAEVLRTGLGLADLSELDALFNYAYSRTGEEGDGE